MAVSPGDDETGATAIEYAFIAGGISIAIVIAITAIGGSLVTAFEDIAALFPE